MLPKQQLHGVWERDMHAVDIMTGHPKGLPNQDEGLRDRLEDACDVPREHFQSSDSIQKRYCDARANESFNRYEPGELVLTISPVWQGKCPKMQMQWIGLWMVLERLNDVTDQVKMNKKEMKIILYELLKPCKTQEIYCNWLLLLEKKTS